MKKRTRMILTLVLTLSFLLGGCQPMAGMEAPRDLTGGKAYITNPQASEADLAKMALANNQFAMALYQTLTDEKENLVFSPYSIYQALIMTYAGARNETEAQMMKVLGVEDNEEVHHLMNALNQTLQYAPDYGDEDFQPLVFNIANALWAQRDFHFEPAFLDKLSENYAAGLKLVDFSKSEETRELINLWVASQTNHKIKDLLPEGLLNEMTRLVLTNAIYFKGAWGDPFNSNFTKKESFNTLDGHQIDVEMMINVLETQAMTNEAVSAAILPYTGHTYAMALMMPEDFAAFQQSFGAEEFSQLLADLKQTNPELTVKLPKFKMESAIDLPEKLAKLGMTDAFSVGGADLSGMTGKKDLFISGVVHKAMIDVNEEGTEAAAATAAVAEEKEMPMEERLSITFDRPFIYVIYNTATNAIIFMGHVIAP